MALSTYRHRSLIAELEDAVRRGSQEKRVETLRRVTDLFLVGSAKLNEEQIQVFDEVLGHLITRMESKALIELSERLAPVNNAPINVVNSLARDDEIAIAAPVLSLSDRLTTADLIEIAMAKSQAHLLAISKRSSLSESLTDTLVERGDEQVIRKDAENEGARLSEKAYACLIERLSWLTLRVLLQDDLLGRAATEDELNKLKSDYIRLSHSTAKKLLEFWCEHQTPQKP